jgi:AraC family transcriptional regulator, regulatory protein of adaptative response / methylated-DNA-[protein]-cysteine methyltransferase
MGKARNESRPSDDTCWRAVQRRDAADDGRLFYGVLTTGVYCRPSCPSRRPRRENVRFFESMEEAERAGLRPCKRCRPREPGQAARHAAAVERACRRLSEAGDAVDLGALSEGAGMSRFHFHRVFKEQTGVTPRAYAEAQRARRVRDALRTRDTVTEAIYEAGFGSGARFYATSKGRLGMTPSELRAGGAGVTVRFAVGQSSLGAILVAASDQGICAVELGDDPDALVCSIQDRLPEARWIGADPEFEALVARVVGLVEDPHRGLDLPLDVRGTAFEERVWRALRAIRPGETASYAEVARRVGSPGAARAVGRACAANPLAVAIPCHRVVRRDGTPSGYRWGVERKRLLLERERKG